jgi:cytochrome oxidase assembly protein ShyY1
MPLFALKNTQDRILWKDWRILKQALNISPTEHVEFFKIVTSDNKPVVKSQLIHEHKLSLDQIPNRHLEYIATWYSLATFSFFMSFMRK